MDDDACDVVEVDGGVVDDADGVVAAVCCRGCNGEIGNGVCPIDFEGLDGGRSAPACGDGEFDLIGSDFLVPDGGVLFGGIGCGEDGSR